MYASSLAYESPLPRQRERDRERAFRDKQVVLESPLPRQRERDRERALVARRMLENAKQLRSQQTDAELRLWYHLRAHRFFGLKFKRQKPIGGYIVDFVCMEQRLIVELDGGQHSETLAYDERRDAWLAGQGYRVLRFWNDDVLRDTEGVLEVIRGTLSPSPSPASGRGEEDFPPASGRGE